MRRSIAAMLLALVTAACAPWQPAAGPSPTPSPPVAAGEGATTVEYGNAPDQVIDLYVPADPSRDIAVMLLHGGSWSDEHGREQTVALASDLARRGYVAANVGYSRIGSGGGWPTTFTDVAAALDTLPRLLADETPLGRGAPIAVVGHSAGGHLALWLAGRRSIPAGQPGTDPAVLPCGVVSMAGVPDLRAAAAQGLGGDAVRTLLGGTPSDVPERYDVGSPIELLPTGVPTLLVHGQRDEIVPTALSNAYVDTATALGDPARLTLTGDDHFSVLRAASKAWQATIEWLDDCGSSAR